MGVMEDGHWRTFCHFFGCRMVPSCRKGLKKPKNNIKAKQKSSMPNSPKKAKTEPKSQTKNFEAKSEQKKAKFHLFG